MDGLKGEDRQDDLAIELFDDVMKNIVKKDTPEGIFNFVIGKAR